MINGPKPRLGLALFLPTVVGLVVVTVLSWLGASALLRQSAQSHLASTLSPLGALLEPMLDDPGAALHARVRELAPGDRLRLTVIEESGLVVADSSRDPQELARMDNHRERPEIAQAFESGTGASIRESPTLGLAMVYAAARVQTPSGRPVVVRLAEPLTAVAALRQRLPLVMIVSIASALLAMGVVALWFHRELFKPLAELVRHAEQLSPGGPAELLAEPRAPEAAALVRAFNHLASRAEEKVGELEAERRSLEAILASLSDGVVVMDGEGRVLRSNPAAAQMFGGSEGAGELEIGDLLPEREKHLVITQSLQARQPCQLEFEIEGTGHTVAMVCSPIEQTGGAVLTARDLTEALHLGEVRRDLVANVSHELKTPLTAIRGYAETLADGAVDDPETRDRFINRIVQQCQRLQALLADLLKLSWLEDKSSIEGLETVPLQDVVAEALEVVLPSAAEKNVSIETDLHPAEIEHASREALAELCLNLLDNGIKYNREGGILAVSVHADPEAGEVVFSVRDTGRGVPEAALHRIFERFYRVDRGRGRTEGGTGLGLAIVKHAVERHGGRIDVTSELGRGTRFEVVLPQRGLVKETSPSALRA